MALLVGLRETYAPMLLHLRARKVSNTTGKRYIPVVLISHQALQDGNPQARTPPSGYLPGHRVRYLRGFRSDLGRIDRNRLKQSSRRCLYYLCCFSIDCLHLCARGLCRRFWCAWPLSPWAYSERFSFRPPLRSFASLFLCS